MKRFLRIYFAVVIGVVLAASIAYMQVRKESGLAPASSGVAGTPIGGSLAGLVDQDGVTITGDRFAAKATLVFFGFTHCPSICPTELQKMTLLLKKLSPEQQEKIAVIFISVDPERDTPAVMKDYVRMFHPAITGVTGSVADIDRVKSEWKVYSAKVKTAEMDEYTVDHSAHTYFRGPDGKLIALFAGTDSPDVMADGVEAWLDQ